MKNTAKNIIVEWLAENRGWHNKSALLELDWKYKDNHASYNKDTVSRKFREAEAEGLIEKNLRNGETFYSSLGTQKPKPREYEPRMVDGVRVMFPV